MIAEKIAKGPRRRFGADPGRPLGEHPTKGGPIAAKNGRYGPYVSHNGVNATLPADKTPESITLEEAAALIDARAERNAPAPHARPRKAQAAFTRYGAARQSFVQATGRTSRQAAGNQKTATENHPSCRVGRREGPGQSHGQ